MFSVHPYQNRTRQAVPAGPCRIVEQLRREPQRSRACSTTPAAASHGTGRYTPPAHTQVFVLLQANKPVIGIVQDTLLGCRLMTKRDTFIGKDVMMNIVMWLEDWNGRMPMPAILRPKPLWTGKQVSSPCRLSGSAGSSCVRAYIAQAGRPVGCGALPLQVLACAVVEHHCNCLAVSPALTVLQSAQPALGCAYALWLSTCRWTKAAGAGCNTSAAQDSSRSLNLWTSSSCCRS